MKPETRRALDAVVNRQNPFWPNRDEAMFIAGMLEAARLCRERAQWLTDNGHHDLANQSITLADAIESSAKGE